MSREQWTRYIEVSSNMAVLVLAVTLLGAVISTRWFRSVEGAKFANGLQNGKILPHVPSIDYGVSPHTLLLFASTKCSYCKDSLPFYKRLLAEQQPVSQHTRVVGIFPNSQSDVDQYKQQNQLFMESVSALNHQSFNVTATPTLILIDSTGRILDFWVGTLSKDEEEQVIKELKSL